MAKHRKTRKEKVVSEKRRQTPSVAPATDGSASSPLFTISSSPSVANQSPVTSTAIGTHQYDYVKADLIKTTILTSSVIIAELILAFVIKL